MEPESLVRDYLSRLGAAAAHLSSERRAELVDEVRGHIELAIAEAGHADEMTIRNVLERIGSADDIVAAEAGVVDVRIATAEHEAAAARPGLSIETRALLLLTIGAVVLPFVGPVLGLWFVSASDRWTLVQKRTAGLIVVVLLTMPVALLVPALVGGEITWVFTSGGFMLPFVPLAGWVAAGYLAGTTSYVVTVSRRE